MGNENIITPRLRLTWRKALFLLAVFSLAWHPRSLGAEILTMTTYYPAPYGGYASLLTTNQTLLARDSGSVGIGTASPAGKLDVSNVFYTQAGKIIVRPQGGSAGGEIQLEGGGYNSWGIGNQSGRFRLHHDGLEYMTIASGGSVGIGTANPGAKLDINGDMKVNGNVGIGVAPNVSFKVWVIGNNTGIRGDGNLSTGFGLYGYGKRGVFGVGDYGVYGQGGTYGVYGWGSYGVYGTGANTGVYGSGPTYDFYAGGAGVDYGSSSSKRWKENIRPIDNALNKVLSLRGVYYDWKKDHGGKHGMGMIAEEVGKIVPEIVTYEDNGIDATGMDYGHLTPVLVEAIKEQQRQIKEQREEINRLKEKLNGLKTTE